MTQKDVNKALKLHQKWLDNKEGGLRADFSGENLSSIYLRCADLRGVDLRGANLDYSSLPLWCGSKKMIVDEKFIYQLLAHVYALQNESEEFKKIQETIKIFAEKSHIWRDLTK